MMGNQLNNELFTLLGVKEYEIANLQGKIHELQLQLEEVNKQLEEFNRATE